MLVEKPLGASFQAFVNHLDSSLGHVATLPIVSQLLNLMVDRAVLTVEHQEGESSPILTAAVLSLAQEKLSVGGFQLEKLGHKFEYESSSKNGEDVSTVSRYTATAHLSGCSLPVSLSYDTKTDNLSISLQPPVVPASIAEVLKDILPKKVPEAMLTILHRVPFTGGAIVLHPSDCSIRTISMTAVSSDTIRLGGVPISGSQFSYTSGTVTPLSNTSLSVPKGLTPAGDHHDYVVADSTSGSETVATSRSPLVFTGTIIKDKLKAKLQVSAPSSTDGENNSLGVMVTSPDKEQLGIFDFLKLLGLSAKKLRFPKNVQAFALTNATGHVRLESTSPSDKSPQLALEDMSFTAEAEQAVVLLKKFNLRFDLFRLNAQYKRSTDLVAAVEARLSLGDMSFWSKLELEGNEQVYRGELIVDNLPLKKLITGLGLPPSFTPPTTIFPESIPLPLSNIHFHYTSGKAIEVIGFGASDQILTCSGIDFKLSALGGHFKVTNSTDSASTGPAIEAYVTGNLVIPGLGTAKARLRYSDEIALLTAVLEASPDSQGMSLSLVSDFLGGKGASVWSTVMPKTTKPLTFDGTGVALQVDFKASRVVALGVVQGVGRVLMLSTPRPDGQSGCYISVAASDLTTLWQSAAQELSSFTISNLGVEILSYETTPAGLVAVIEPLLAEVAVKGSLPKSPVSLTTLDPTRPLLPGAWFFATVDVNGPSEMGRALSLIKDPSCKSIITLYARVSQMATDSVYWVKLQNFGLLGGRIMINGTGTYTPADKQVAIDATLTLNGLVEQPLVFDVLLKIGPGETVFTTKEPEVLTAAENTTNSVRGGEPSPLQVKKQTGSNELTTKQQDTASPSRPLTESIGNLFKGKMFNVELTAPKFKGLSKNQDGKTTHTQVLTAGVRLGGGDIDPTVAGTIFFDLGKPQVACIDFKRPIAIQDVFSRVLGPSLNKKVSWPAQLPTLELSGAKMYYSPDKGKINVDGFEYLPGYHVQADVRILERIFRVTVDLPENRKGVMMTGSYLGDLDLGFGTIRSPRISVDTTSSKYVS